jgi:plastocyanin
VDGLPATTWAFYCAVTDNYGNSASSPYTTVKVYYAAPTFTGTQGNINVNPGQSFTLSWTATDGAPTTYTITCNGATLKSGQSWTSGTPITYQGSQSSLGSYTYTITVYDASGSSYSSSSSATVTVWLFTSTQPNIYAGLGVQFTLSWTAKASNPTTYTITCNGAQVAGGSWKSGVPINLPQTLNKAGTYNYTITVNSSQGSSSISCTVTVRVVKGQ